MVRFISGILIALGFSLTAVNAAMRIADPPDSLFPARALLTARVGLMLAIVLAIVGILVAVTSYRKNAGFKNATGAAWVKAAVLGFCVALGVQIVYAIVGGVIVAAIRQS